MRAGSSLIPGCDGSSLPSEVPVAQGHRGRGGASSLVHPLERSHGTTPHLCRRPRRRGLSLSVVALGRPRPRGWASLVALALCAWAWAPAVSAQQFSLQCRANNQPYDFTFDVNAGRVILESLAGRPFPGRISTATSERIEFEVKAESDPKFDLAWDARTNSVTWTGVPGRPSRPTRTDPCSAIALRPILFTYEPFGPYETYYPPDPPPR